MRNLLSRPATAVAAMFAVVIGAALMPLVREPRFYFWDDTQAAAAGVWQRIPDELLAGNIPFLQVDMWRGGNFAGEAATGAWNPIVLALMFVSRPFDDMAIAMTISKIALMLICAGGVYVLARGYGARVWPAAVVGAAMPLSGWQLFVDGTSWINGTTMTAFTPWAWWALRRAAVRGFPPWGIVLAVVTGYLLISTGNPFTALIIVVIYLAVLVEMVGSGQWRRSGWLVLVGLATLLTILVVYLPFVGTSSVGGRPELTMFGNREYLTANLNHFAAMSASSYLPWINGVGGPLKVPAAYLAWFVVPLLPWLNLRILKRWCYAGIAVVAAVFTAIVIGPSDVWMFRWPVRMIPFAYLPLMIAFAVVLSGGFLRTRARQRFLSSLALIAVAGWIAFSDDPGPWKWHALTTVVIVVLVVLAVLAARGPRLFAVTAAGGVLLLAAQLAVSPSYSNHADHGMASSRDELSDNFESRYLGTTLQITKRDRSDQWVPDEASRDLSIGNMYAAAGVDSLTAYSGIGFTKLDDTLCTRFNGQMCVDAWDAVFEPRGDGPVLADQLRLETVVLQRDLAEFEAPAGWEIAEVTEYVTVYRRVGELPLPGSTVGAVGDGLEVTESVREGETTERARFRSVGAGDRSVTFARVAWPGYAASVGGREVPVETTDAGLVRVEVPEGVDEGTIELTFTPPGLPAGLGAMGVGVLLTAGLALTSWRRATRGRRQTAPASHENGRAVQ